MTLYRPLHAAVRVWTAIAGLIFLRQDKCERVFRHNKHGVLRLGKRDNTLLLLILKWLSSTADDALFVLVLHIILQYISRYDLLVNYMCSVSFPMTVLVICIRWRKHRCHTTIYNNVWSTRENNIELSVCCCCIFFFYYYY